MSGRTINKRKAIRNALFRLGMQAKPGEVVDALARFGIDVSKGLVCQVRMAIQKSEAKAARNRLKQPAVSKRLYRPQQRKAPPSAR